MGKDGVMNPRNEEEGSQGWKGRGSQLGKSLGLKELTNQESAMVPGNSELPFPDLGTFAHRF
jgi:hypothetical protein